MAYGVYRTDHTFKSKASRRGSRRVFHHEEVIVQDYSMLPFAAFYENIL